MGTVAGGVGKGALTGAGVTAPFAAAAGPFAPLVIAGGALVGGIAGGLGESEGSGKGKRKLAKAYRDQLEGDLEKMKAGELGLTDADKEKIVSQSQQLAGQQIAQMQREGTRQFMGQGAPAYQGKYSQAMRGLAGEGAEAGAKARMGVEKLSADLAEARRTDLLNRMAALEQGDRQERMQQQAMQARYGYTEVTATTDLMQTLDEQGLFDRL